MTVPAPAIQARLVKEPAGTQGDVGALAPIFPPTRLLKSAVLEVEQTRRDAVELLEKAKAQAAELVAQARAEADAVREQARLEAIVEIQAELAGLVRSFQSAVSALDEQLAIQASSLAFPLARSIVECELDINPERFVGLAIAALRSARNASSVKLVLHPCRAGLVRPVLGAVSSQAGVTVSVELREDPDIEVHGVRVETEDGWYEGGLDVRMRLLSEQVRRAATEEGRA